VDRNWIGLVIFKNFAVQGCIGFNIIGTGLDSNEKISLSAHLWFLPFNFMLRTSPLLKMSGWKKWGWFYLGKILT